MGRGGGGGGKRLTRNDPVIKIRIVKAGRKVFVRFYGA